MQIYSNISHLPSVLLGALPIIPHAAERLSRDTFRVDQNLRDIAEGLTPEILGMMPIEPTPPEESTEPSDIPSMEIQHLVRNLTGIRPRRGRQSLRRNVVRQPSTNTSLINNTASTSTPVERILLRVIKQKRAKDILTLTKSLALLPGISTTVTEPSVTLTTISSVASPARVAGGMRITSLPNRSGKRRRENELTTSSKWTRTSSDTATLESPQTENIQQSILTTIENPSATVGTVIEYQPPNIGSLRRPSTSKRKRPPDENHHESPKRLRAVVHQDAHSITPMELSSTDLINLNVCLTSDMSASSDTHSKPLTTSAVLMETGNNDIFTFTQTVESFSPPADSVSGMDFANDVLPIRVVNVCVLASPLPAVD